MLYQTVLIGTNHQTLSDQSDIRELGFYFKSWQEGYYWTTVPTGKWLQNIAKTVR